MVGGSEAESEAWNEERNEDWRSESGERRKVKLLINRALIVSGCLVFQYPEIHKTLINKRLTLPGQSDVWLREVKRRVEEFSSRGDRKGMICVRCAAGLSC